MFLPERLKIIFGIVVLALLVLGVAARRYPYVAWLQPFDLQRHVSPEQRERLRRSGNVSAGVQLILLGFVIPLAYLGIKLMFFSATTRTETSLALGAGVLCVVLGVTAIVRARS